MKLNIQAKRQHFMSLQSKTIDNDKKFWKTVKPLFFNKNPMSEKITLIEDGRILSNDVEVAECFNEHFCNITDSLGIATGVLKATREIVCPYLTDCINSAVYDCKLPNELKEADLICSKMMI